MVQYSKPPIMGADSVIIEMTDETHNSVDTFTEIETEMAKSCCNELAEDGKIQLNKDQRTDQLDGGRAGYQCRTSSNSYASSKNVAEGMMDIALLSANANQLRFLITYNSESSTYYISLGLIVLSLVMQVAVGIALIFKRRMYKCSTTKRINRTNEFLIGGVFIVTVINILLAAFTTTDSKMSHSDERKDIAKHHD